MTRAGFLILHRRIALAIAPFLLVQAVTGAALLFHAPLARLLDPAAMNRHSREGVAPVSTLLRSASAAAPGYRMERLYLPADPADVAFAHLSGPGGDARYASVDPGDGRVLASGAIWRFPLEAALQIHYRLLDGRLGMMIILANGVALLLLSLTGLRFWWPGRGRVAKNLTIRAGAPGRLRLRQWHRSGGVVASALLVFSATTGVLLIVPDLTASAGGHSAAAPRPTADQIDRAVMVAQTRFPAHHLRDIRFPAADRIDVNLFAPERNARAVHVVSVAVSDGRILHAIPAAENPVLWMKVLALHTGDSLGLIGRFLLLLEALVLAALALTGPVTWWQARRMRLGARR